MSTTHTQLEWFQGSQLSKDLHDGTQVLAVTHDKDSGQTSGQFETLTFDATINEFIDTLIEEPVSILGVTVVRYAILPESLLSLKE